MTPETSLFLASLDFLTKPRLDALNTVFPDLETAFKNFSISAFLETGIPKKSLEILDQKIKELPFFQIQKQFEKSGAKILFYEDENFPTILKNIPDPPLFLFLKGDITPDDKDSLAVVGTRRPSKDGIRAVQEIVPDLVRAGFTIISGMAQGIDTCAHKEAILSKGRTIAFWGTGIDVVYPSSNARLAEDIIQNGAIFSEFPLGALPEAYHFPKRNRLISGFSKGVFVVEGKEKSGSLITAHSALEQGKEVFALPGSPFSVFARGPNMLIQKGEAKLVIESKDILEEFGILEVKKEKSFFLPQNDQEEKLWNILSLEGKLLDEICRESKISLQEVMSILMMMSLRGDVKDLGNNVYARGW